jgi:primosomal protein N' (replication factor Y)
VRVAELTGEPADVDDLLLLAALPAAADVLGPVVVDGASRALVRAPLSEGAGMTAALRAASAVRSARRSGAPVRVRVDPVVLG